ncbi:MAG TPA: DNA-directed RNA polymerase subunit beta' [Dehalococcoidia bacterium]|jgi:DNA-directed RNA polymerase subunit beta'|nr:DNA-directed RNA polymerase subunit beta' [Dehalococcoidia bacterium]
MVGLSDARDISTDSRNFNALKISIASPEQILNWSHGEVTKPETINYRTLRPEKDGLFCEKLFGPTKDWECFCGKYKRIRYRGVICDRCGVEVTRSKVRRERMAHIQLAAPVAHIWFSKTTPSRLGLLLDLSPRNLERVLYFAQHIIISVDEESKQQLSEESEALLERNQRLLTESFEEQMSTLNANLENAKDNSEASKEAQSQIESVKSQYDEQMSVYDQEHQQLVDDFSDMIPQKLITESKYRELNEKYADAFDAGMGAEAIQKILRGVDLHILKAELAEEMKSTSGQKRKKAIKRLRVVEAFRGSGNHVSDMIMSVLPVLPPELRPMVQLDGGRFATSDLNDLYRRVINRNNRLKRLIELGAPDIIIRNEKRMLQESVDALIDNGRRGRPIQGSHNHKLKSLSDLLRGKQGRFRQNLLGKRVDYSGRSVIVVGPELHMDQCGLPKKMALELFKPFVMHKLVLLGISPNIKSAKRMVERARPEVWDILEDVIKDRPVMLNRAPTLHRLGIQAFMPILIEGNAIQLHPLVCTAFNADFDGDQMAAHVPLSRLAVQEAKAIMLSTHNMLSPASGDPQVAPTLDMVMGCYYLTQMIDNTKNNLTTFHDADEARIAHASDIVGLRDKITIISALKPGAEENMETTLGRIIFNEILPDIIPFRNIIMDRGAIRDLTAELYLTLTNEETANALDAIKGIGFKYATVSGTTIAIADIQVPEGKDEIIDKATQKVDDLEELYLSGLMSEDERYVLAVDAWTAASDETEKLVQNELHKFGGMADMAISGAKGNIAQIKQMAGMRGLMSNPKGRIIDLPIKSSFREGLTALEYFISTHGARKGLADTALRTADSGYLTRRLVDISQEIIVFEEDCETISSFWLNPREDDETGTTIGERSIGRVAASPIANPITGEIIVDRNETITKELAAKIVEAKLLEIPVRSALHCEALRGVCKACYGILPATGKVADIGQAVGIIAAQSIGEPGTQLTMRTFHTGGIASAVDITSGLPRVEELFEARVPKGAAYLAEIAGKVLIEEDDTSKIISIISEQEFSEDYEIPKEYKLLVANGENVEPGTILGYSDSKDETHEIIATTGGLVALTGTTLSITWEDIEERQLEIPLSAYLLVSDGDEVNAGDPITPGPKNPHDILRIQGTEALQKYLIAEVQSVYRSQGVSIHDKHIEVIVSQMLRRVNVDTPGDTEYIPGQIVEIKKFTELNMNMQSMGKEPAAAHPMLLGITRASLLTDSFLAAASFQETTRVLTQAAISGAHDKLQGLKENVIIGRLIPAKLDTPEMRELLATEKVEQILEPADIQAQKWLDGDSNKMVDDSQNNSSGENTSATDNPDENDVAPESGTDDSMLSIVDENLFDAEVVNTEASEEAIQSIFDGNDVIELPEDPSDDDAPIEGF